VALTFPTIGDGTCAEQQVTPGVQWPAGSTVAISLPLQYCSTSNGICYVPPGLEANARVSSTGVVSVRVCNLSGASQTLPTANYLLTPYGGAATTVTLSLSTIADGSCATQSVSVPGATTSSAIAVGLPATLEPGLIVTAAPAGAGSAQITACNWSGAAITPATATYQIGVI